MYRLCEYKSKKIIIAEYQTCEIFDACTAALWISNLNKYKEFNPSYISFSNINFNTKDLSENRFVKMTSDNTTIYNEITKRKTNIIKVYCTYNSRTFIIGVDLIKKHILLLVEEVDENLLEKLEDILNKNEYVNDEKSLDNIN